MRYAPLKRTDCWFIPMQCLKPLIFYFNWHSPSLCQVLPESGTLWNQLFFQGFVMCCFVISAIVVPWVEMIWTDSGWHPVLSFIQQFTTPKVFCIICAASAGPLWWVTPSIFCCLLQLCEQPCFMAREIWKASYAVTLSSFRSVFESLALSAESSNQLQTSESLHTCNVNINSLKLFSILKVLQLS